MQNKKNKKYLRAFTLVELIIVITILAILATISFVSFSGYTKNSRDANRLSTLTNVEKGLIAYQVTTGKYPVPDNAITISDSGITIGQQGVIGANVSNLLKISKVPTDPQDGTNYVYSKNESGNKYQLMTFLESQKQTALIGKTYADFSTRFPTTQGDNLGIILDVNNTPISTNVVLPDTSNTMRKVYFKNEVKIGTGVIFTALKTTYTKMWKDTDKNCDIDDIVIGDQIWAGCNSTLGNGREWGRKSDGTSGVIACFGYDGVGIDSSHCPAAVKGNEMMSNAKEKSWSIASGLNSTQNNIWGKFYKWSNSQEACPTGWHVPSDTEWEKLETNLNNGINCRNGLDSWQCDGLGYSGSVTKNETNNIVKALKMPLSGNQHFNDINSNVRGNGVHIWSSTASGAILAYGIGIHLNESRINRVTFDKGYNFIVRCIRD